MYFIDQLLSLKTSTIHIQCFLLEVKRKNLKILLEVLIINYDLFDYIKYKFIKNIKRYLFDNGTFLFKLVLKKFFNSNNESLDKP